MAEIKVQRRGTLAKKINETRSLVSDARLLEEAFEEWALYELDPEIQDVLSNRILKRRTGTLARSTFFKDLRATKSQVSVRVVTTVYGPVHEYGAVIRPRRRTWLTVPLPAAQTPAGVTRYSARDYPGAFLLKTRTGKLFIAKRGSRKGKLDFLFVLKKEVKIPARKWFSVAARRALGRLPKYLGEEIRKK